MIPVYFPFTYVDKIIVQAMGTCFKQVALYQPLGNLVPDGIKEWAEDGVIDLRIPALEDEEKILSIIRDYQSWVKNHGGTKGIDPDLLKARQGSVPFFDHTSASQIKADIKHKMDEGTPVKGYDPLFTSRLFLGLAQDFDVNDFESGQDLRSFEIVEQRLFKHMRGEIGASIDENHINTPNIALDQRDFMIPERISAWFRLFHRDCQNQGFDIPGLFITSSAAVFDEIIRKTPDSEAVFCMENMAVDRSRPEDLSEWQDELSKYLKQIVFESDPSIKFETLPPDRTKSGETVITLKFYVMINETPYGWFDKVFGNKIKRLGDSLDQIKVKNTVMGLIESRLSP